MSLELEKPRVMKELFSVNEQDELTEKIFNAIVKYNKLNPTFSRFLYKNSVPIYNLLWILLKEDVYKLKSYNLTTLECFNKLSLEHSIYCCNQLRNEKINTCVDFGGGLGLSTTIFQKYLTSNTEYFDFPHQIKFMKYLRKYLSAKVHHNINTIDTFEELTNKYYDVVIAFDVFEHFVKPEDTYKMLRSINTRFLCESSAFKYACCGHYPEYIIKDQIVDRKKAADIFTDIIKEDYELFASRPNYKLRIWKKKK